MLLQFWKGMIHQSIPELCRFLYRFKAGITGTNRKSKWFFGRDWGMSYEKSYYIMIKICEEMFFVIFQAL